MTLVFKVTEPSSYHGNAMLVAIFKREFILDTSTRLDDGCYAFIAGNFHAVGKGKNASLAITAPFKSKPKFWLSR